MSMPALMVMPLDVGSPFSTPNAELPTLTRPRAVSGAAGGVARPDTPPSATLDVAAASPLQVVPVMALVHP